jgi:hypothetical protein
MKNKSMKNNQYLALIAVVLAGCATRPVVYSPAPPPAPVARPPVVVNAPSSAETMSPTLKTVAKNKDNLWRSVSAALPGTRFTIDSVDFKSGLMQLRYAGDPRNYIDCGKVTVKLPTGDKTLEFPAARAYQQYQIMNRDRIFNVDRRMNLEAQLRLTLQPLDAQRTSALVETRYALTRDQLVTPVSGGTPFNTSDSVNFTHDTGATFPNPAIRCTATLQLENELMQLVR